MWPNPQFTEEFLKEKNHFLCSMHIRTTVQLYIHMYNCTYKLCKQKVPSNLIQSFIFLFLFNFVVYLRLRFNDLKLTT